MFQLHTAYSNLIFFLIGELKLFYQLSCVAFVGGSLFKGMAGHNIAEAAAAGCAIVTGMKPSNLSEKKQITKRKSNKLLQEVME